MTTIIALDSVQHQQFKLDEDDKFLHAQNLHVIPVEINEFAAAAVSLPIVFVKDSGTGQFRACVLTGLKPGQNLVCNDKGWQANYIPQALRNYPLTAVKSRAENDDFIVAVDSASHLFNEHSGQALFSANTATVYLQQRAQAAIRLASSVELTQRFIASLIKLGLIVAKTLSLTPEDADPYELTGFYVIDERRLAQLGDEQWLSLRNGNYLLAVSAVLMSMHQMPLLLARLQQKGGAC